MVSLEYIIHIGGRGIINQRSFIYGLGSICDMEVKPESAKTEYEYKGKTYYFCVKGCKNAFEKEPKIFKR